MRKDLSSADKTSLLERYKFQCFIEPHTLTEADKIEFDHIVALAEGGDDSLSNLAPVCKTHHNRKRTLSLQDYRDKLALERAFEKSPTMYLDDIVALKFGTKPEILQYEALGDGRIAIHVGGITKYSRLETCPATGWRYFYSLLPVQILENDQELQPRPLRVDPLWKLFRHFKTNSQLSPSICRVTPEGKVLLFDGQHKAAAQVWNGRDHVECKVYLQPSAAKLKQTNLEAHDEHRQMAFWPVELIAKWATLFADDWTSYKELPGEKSEASFVRYLAAERSLSQADAVGEIRKAYHWSILDDPSNKLRAFMGQRTRTRNEPLTYSLLSKSIFSDFSAKIPSDIPLDDVRFKRDEEQRSIVQLMSFIAEEGLVGRWNPDRRDAAHLKADRIFSSGAVRGWSRLLQLTTREYLKLVDLYPSPPANEVLFRELNDEQLRWLQLAVRAIFSHPVWEVPDSPQLQISAVLSANEVSSAESLFGTHGLNPGWIRGQAAKWM